MQSPSAAIKSRLLAVAVCGLLLRFAIAAVSIGSSDVQFWKGHGESIAAHGLFGAYAVTRWYNHPPLAGLWGWLSLVLAGGDLHRFAMILKLPGLLAEVGTALLMRRVGGDGLMAAYAWCLPAILISGFHGNTDAVYVFFCVLAVVLWQVRQQPFWSGLSLGLALNVKLLPVVLVPMFLLHVRDRRELLRLAGGLALAALPFVPGLFVAAQPMLRGLLDYQPVKPSWGLNAFFNFAHPSERLRPLTDPIASLFQSAGRQAILVAIVGLGVWNRWRRRWSLAQSVALAAGLFLVFAPGFGVQYCIFPAALLTLADGAAARRFGLVCGLFLLVVYYSFIPRNAHVPFESDFLHPDFVPAAVLVGVLAWRELVVAAGRLIRARPQDGPPLAPRRSSARD